MHGRDDGDVELGQRLDCGHHLRGTCILLSKCCQSRTGRATVHRHLSVQTLTPHYLTLVQDMQLTSLALKESSPDVGSSTNSSRVSSAISPSPMLTRFACPPDVSIFGVHPVAFPICHSVLPSCQPFTPSCLTPSCCHSLCMLAHIILCSRLPLH